ncbi:MAG: hypothetical protein CMP70_03955 [Flavobacteriales bacterium]|nr:hypothetical protein [Flavobacteriales bacterium]|tara:strand:+ start:1169 stop:2440 length:1272 start_codon:yes stop_codon:yes gene_type:complete
MKFVLFFIKACLISSLTQAQSILDLKLKAVDLYHSEMYLEAEEEFKTLKSRSKYERYKLELDFLRALCFYNLLDERNLKKSKSIFKRLINRKNKINSEVYSNSLLFYGRALHRLSELDSALVYLKKYKKFSKDNFADDDIKSVLFSLKNKNNYTKFTLNRCSFNSIYDDYSLTSIDDNSFILASNRPKSNKKNSSLNSDLYYLEFNVRINKWSRVIPCDKYINSEGSELSPFYSANDSICFFSRSTKVKDSISLSEHKIYFIHNKNKLWSNPALFPLPYDGSNFKNPYLTNDGNTLFFSSDMNGGYGGYDIWMIKKKSNGFWSMPINLGMSVNTIKDELYPYISDNTFYFSSNGHLGLGGFDIFKAGIDQYFNILYVDNMGYPVNSTNDDNALIFKNDSIGYLSSNRVGSINFDIYKLQNYEN